MGILTTADALTLVPSLSSMDPLQLGAIVNYVNFLVESPAGANRTLGIKQYTENIRLTLKLQNCYLAYWPIIKNDSNYPMSFQIRIADALNYYGRAVPVQPWIPLDNKMIQIDDNDQLNLFLTAAYFYNYPEFSASIRTIATEMKATYYAGLNIVPVAQHPSPEVYNLKMAAAQILQYYLSQIYSGVTSIQSPFDEFTVNFNNSQKPFQVPDYLLQPFKLYQPHRRY